MGVTMPQPWSRSLPPSAFTLHVHNCQPLYTYSRYLCFNCLFWCRCMPTQLPFHRQGLNTAWLVMYSPYLGHLRGTADEGRCQAESLLLSACVQHVYTTVSTCIHRHTVGIHTPAAYSDAAANKTAVRCTVSVHTLTVFLAVFYKRHLSSPP